MTPELAAKFYRVLEDIRAEELREEYARRQGLISQRGSNRWQEVRDEESGPDEDWEDE